MACDHEKARITTDSGEEVCPICDDVRLESVDSSETIAESDDSAEVQVETTD